MKKINVFLMAFVFGTATMFGQTLNDAIKLTTSEQFAKADAAFQALIQSQPNSGEFLFYYGENFYKNDQIAKANAQYQKAVEVNATSPFGYIGVGKVMWNQGKQADAKTNLFKATTLAAGKNATVLIKVAEVYIHGEVKNLPDAFTLLNQAAKLEPKNPEVYIMMGDAFLEQNEGTKAVENYEKAGTLDPKSPKALLRQGQVWNRAKNYTLAIETYKKAIAVDPNFAPAYLEMSEIYLRAAQYQNAFENASRYIQLNQDCSALSRYAGKANLAKKYKESVEGAIEALKCDPNNAYTYRYKGRSEYELGNFADGIVTFTTFFDMAAKNPELKVSGEDYEYLAKLYAKNAKDSLAIINFKKALEMQPEKVELNGDIAACYVKLKKYKEAVEAYKLKIASGKTNANDQFGIGRAYFFGKDFINADSAFSNVIKAQPDLALGYLWRAKAKVQQEVIAKTENWSAKADYEAFISKVKPEDVEKNKKDLIEAYNYLGAYYAKQKDCANTKANFQKVLELDPANEQAKKVISGLKC